MFLCVTSASIPQKGQIPPPFLGPMKTYAAVSCAICSDPPWPGEEEEFMRGYLLLTRIPRARYRGSNAKACLLVYSETLRAHTSITEKWAAPLHLSLRHKERARARARARIELERPGGPQHSC